MSVLTQKHKDLIEQEIKFHDRLSGVFFMKHFGTSRFDKEGELTPFAVEVYTYWNQLKSKIEAKAQRVIEQRNEIRHQRRMQAIKNSNRAIKRSNNLSQASMISRIKWVTEGDKLKVILNRPNGVNPARVIRRYLRSNGIRRMGQSICSGVAFSGDAVKEVLGWLNSRLAEKTSFSELITSVLRPFCSVSLLKRSVDVIPDIINTS